MKFHVLVLVCKLHSSCRKNIFFCITLQQDKMDMEVIPSFKHTLAVLGWLDWRFIRTASEWRIFGAVEFSRVFHIMLFLGFPWFFHKFSICFLWDKPWVYRASARRSIQRLLWSRSSQRWPIPQLEGVQLGLLPGHNGYQRMVIPCYTIVIGLIVGSYRFLGVISYNMSYCNYSNNPYKSGENPLTVVV